MTQDEIIRMAREAGCGVSANCLDNPMYEFTSLELERFAAIVAAPLQAKIDALMLEYCPDEMTPEQLNGWAKNQKPPAFLRRVGSFGHE